jgi:hypothetical protein
MDRMMNVDQILRELNGHEVAYILIGGMNFLFRHAPVVTFDVDIWIDEAEQKQQRMQTLQAALDKARLNRG